MGYRSEVAIKVYGTPEQNAAFKQRFEAEVEALEGADLQDAVDLYLKVSDSEHKLFSDTGFVFHIIGVKWYEENDHVEFFTDMMEIAENELNMSGEFVRLGDDLDDNEFYQFGDDCQYSIRVSRSLEL